MQNPHKSIFDHAVVINVISSIGRKKAGSQEKVEEKENVVKRSWMFK